MTIYIDVEELKKELICNKNFYPTIIKNALEKMPSADVVEVVRCKDCKRYIKGRAGEQSNYCDCHTTTFEKFFCMPNDYCSCGERRDEK